MTEQKKEGLKRLEAIAVMRGNVKAREISLFSTNLKTPHEKNNEYGERLMKKLANCR